MITINLTPAQLVDILRSVDFAIVHLFFDNIEKERAVNIRNKVELKLLQFNKEFPK